MPLIDIRNVYKIYNPGENEVHALDGVTLKVEREEFVAIVGQSGSGKSTLMNMIGLLDSPTSGEYYLDDEDVSKLSDDKLSEIRNKQIGFIFQGFNLIPSLTAQANVELPLVYRGMAAQERHELSIKALERVGLGHRLDHRPSEMSGGQQQRVAIARAVAARPPVILADEPTGALDSKSARLLLESLEALNRRLRATVLMVTHDSFAASYTSRVLFIRDGKIFTELRRGDTDRREFFDRIMEVVAMMGGEGSDAL